MSDDEAEDGGEKTVHRLLTWRRAPTAAATIALCDALRGAEARASIVEIVARSIAKLHWEDPAVLRALGRLQLSAGQPAQGRRSFQRAARLEYLGKKSTAIAVVDVPPPSSAEGPRPFDQETRDHSPPPFLLDLLRAVDDDEAIVATAQRKPTPRPRLAARSSGTLSLSLPPPSGEPGGSSPP